VLVVEAGNDAAAFEVKHHGVRPALVRFRVVHADDSSILDGEIRGGGLLRVERGDASVVEDQVGNQV